MQLQLRDRAVDPSTSPLVMGVLNVTPDSFSDGGSYSTAEEAVARAFEIITEGADIIDIGPESTRPGSRPVAPDDQIARAVPVVAAVREANPRITISIDTRLAPVAQAALDAGADMINDISALGDDPGMVEVVARPVVRLSVVVIGAPEIRRRRRQPTGGRGQDCHHWDRDACQ